MRFTRYSGILWTVSGVLSASLLAAGEPGISPFTLSPEHAAESIHFEANARAKPFTNFDSPLSFSLPNGEETYQIVVDGHPRHSERPSCSEDELRNVTVNGQSLDLASHDQGDPELAYLFGTVSAQDEASGRQRGINLVVNAKCFHAAGARGAAQNQNQKQNHVDKDHPWEATTPVLGVNLVVVLDVDGRPWTENPFTVSHRLVNGHVPEVSIVSPSSVVPSQQQPSHHVSVETYLPIAPSAPSQPEQPVQPEFSYTPSKQSSVIALASHSSNTNSDDSNVAKELQKLQELRNNLEASQNAVKEQEELIHSILGDSSFAQVKKVNKPCGIKQPSCLLKKFSLKCREYIEKFLGSFDAADEQNRCHGISKMNDIEKAKVLASGADDCGIDSHKVSARPSTKSYQPLLSDDGDSASESFVYADSDREILPTPSSSTHTVHTALGVVAALLCLTCITTCLHRRCCNPRARAERAARREERRTRRQYRCAARKQAWHDWWADRRGCFCLHSRGCGSSRRTGDYEEKRALILQQEAVLENAMQDEIHTLRRQARGGRVGPIDDVLSMVEEGRASPVSEASFSALSEHSFGRPPSIAETLPPYRSRSGSGRPPSYNEVDQHAESVVADGFPEYSPSAFVIGDDHSSSSDDDDEARSSRSIRSLTSLRSARSLRTNRSSPSSSVVDLSPRHSSETLRTERSSV